MTDPLEGDARRETLLTQALRDLPARRAPRTLEARVLDELQRRAAQAWWRRGFAQWPWAARLAFIGVCVMLIGLTSWLKPRLVPGPQALNDALIWSLSWAHPALTVMASAASVLNLLARAIPAPWAYAGAGLAAMLYVTLFGLGAAAYRTLYLQPGGVLPPAGRWQGP